jgi:hypothetical protein
MFARRFLLVALVFATVFTLTAATAADVDRGRALYESRCFECHSPAAHSRPAHVAGDFNEIRAWVRRWSDHLGLEWTEEDIANVTVYLNNSYYRYPCPADVCPVVGVSR